MTGSNPDNRTDRDDLAEGLAFHKEVYAEFIAERGVAAQDMFSVHKRILGAALRRRDAAVASRTRAPVLALADEIEAEIGWKRETAYTAQITAIARRIRATGGG